MAEDTSKNGERGHDRFRWRERFEKKDSNQNQQSSTENSYQKDESQNQTKSFDKNQNFNRNNNFNNQNSNEQNNSVKGQNGNGFKQNGNVGEDGKEKENPSQNDAKQGQNSQKSSESQNDSQKLNLDEYVKKEEFLNLKYKFSEVLYRYKEFEHEFENYKKRTREEIASAKVAGMTKAIETILPALDSFGKAKAIISDQKSLSGIDMIEKSILAELEKLGVRRINCRGQKFDPDYHNAIMLVETSKVKSGYIVDEVEAGYTIGDKVIKYSKVTVSK